MQSYYNIIDHIPYAVYYIPTAYLYVDSKKQNKNKLS